MSAVSEVVVGVWMGAPVETLGDHRAVNDAARTKGRANSLALALLCLVVCGACGVGSSKTRGSADSVARAARYLWHQQQPDGAWRSETYGLLGGGESMTAFVAETLLRVPEEVFQRPGATGEIALDYLEGHVSEEGALGLSDPAMPDYPNYATALGLRALLAAGRTEAIDSMKSYLLSQQLIEQNGWSRDDPAYGAWGMGGQRRRPPNPGHVDLSMTRSVVEALAATGVKPDAEAFRKARVFIERCRNVDGGFQFSTVVDEANKAGHGVSYGTATADGLRALALVNGDAPESDWLRQYHVRGYVPGFDRHPDRRWRDGLWFYYVGTATALLPPHQAAEIGAELRSRQRPDGSWSNQEALVKEDDPLVATVFALRALLGEF